MRQPALRITLKTIFSLLSVIYAAAFCNGCSENLVLVDKGLSQYKICLSENATPVEKFAASELQKYILEISDCRLPIDHRYEKQKKLIFIGFGDAPASLRGNDDISSYGPEEYLIRSAGNQILIAGGRPRGTLYGVIGFLSDYLNCRWYTPDYAKIPQQQTIRLAPVNQREKPVFEYREAWYREAYQAEWAVHNRLNPSIVSPPDSMGGGYKIYPFVHTFYQLVSPEKYFKSHPEYFSLIDGKRKGHEAQLCLTNPQVVKIATQTVYRWISEHPDVQVLSIDQNDGYGWCTCENCRAVDEAEGSHAGTILRFVNQIADTLAKTNPQIRIQTLAYAYSEIPPKIVKPRANVTIRLCHYNYCCAHHLLGCNNHKVFIDRLLAWGKIAGRLTIWDYFTDFSHYLIPFPNFESLKHDVKFYADHHCIGLFAQGCNVPQKGGGEFSALRAWVFSRLMWNPYQDAQALIDEFVREVYGDAAPYIKSYIDLLHEKVKPDSVFFSIYAKPTDGGYLTPELVSTSARLFEEAEKAVAGDPALLRRVELASLPVIYSRLYFYATGGKAFLNAGEMPEVLAKFQRIIKENNITRIAEGTERGDIDAFVKKVNHHDTYLTDWWIIGPFDNREGKGLFQVYPPENEIDMEKSYLGINNQKVFWRKIENHLSGYIDFTKLFKESEIGVAYAYMPLNISQPGDYRLGIGSNDGARLWINGKLVLDHMIARKAEHLLFRQRGLACAGRDTIFHRDLFEPPKAPLRFGQIIEMRLDGGGQVHIDRLDGSEKLLKTVDHRS